MVKNKGQIYISPRNKFFRHKRYYSQTRSPTEDNIWQHTENFFTKRIIHHWALIASAGSIRTCRVTELTKICHYVVSYQSLEMLVKNKSRSRIVQNHRTGSSIVYIMWIREWYFYPHINDKYTNYINRTTYVHSYTYARAYA